jgi:hypothetical protein
MTEEKRKEFEELAKPLMKFLCDNFHPHCHIIIEPTTAEVSIGEIAFTTEEFLRD